MTIENNTKIQTAELNVLSSQDMLAVYKTNNLPKLSLSANYIYSTASLEKIIESIYLPSLLPEGLLSSIPTEYFEMLAPYMSTPEVGLKLSVESLFNTSVAVSQPIYMGSKVRNAVQMAKVGVTVAELRKKLTTSELIVAVDEAYYTHLMIEELSRSAKSYYTVVEEFNRQMTNGYKSGMKTRNDLLKVQVVLNEAELAMRKASNAIALSRMNLCQLLGLPLTTKELVLDDTVNATELDRDFSEDVTSRVEYKLLEKQIEAKRLETKIARADYLPSLAAMASYGYTNGLQFNNQTLINSLGFTGGVSLSVPIFSWGEGKRKISALRNNEQVAINELKETQELMTLELLQSINILDEAQVEVVLREKALEQAAENMRLSLNQYNAGMESLSNYLESQALWQKAMSDLVSATSKQRIAYSKYLKAAGEL